MVLPAIDVGLMAEHLSTHEGMLYKLEYYYGEVANPTLQEIIGQQLTIMHNHVKVMLSLLDSNQNNWVEVPPLGENAFHMHHHNYVEKKPQDKPIALEAKATAKAMANTNFMSALMMKNVNVKHAHFEMAIQQAILEREYGEFTKRMGWDHPPMATEQAQLNVIENFQHLVDQS